MPFINDRLAESSGHARDGGTSRASRFRFDPQAVSDRLRRRLVGQDAVVAAMADMLRVVKADIGADERPLAVHLFLGPTGVGKTETVRQIAEAIHGHADAFCRIDMNTLGQAHYAAALTGAPPGYTGSKEGHTLFDIEAIQGSFGKPGIVLFDELEKAGREVTQALLNVLDNGRLVLTSGNRTVDFRNALVFLTSNVGAAEAERYRQRFRRGWRRWLRRRPQRARDIVEAALRERFEPEFLNRIDRLHHFDALDDDVLPRLLTLELERLNHRLSRQGAELALDAEVSDRLCHGLDLRYGARELARRLRSELHPALAVALHDHPAADRFVAIRQAATIRVVPASSRA